MDSEPTMSQQVIMLRTRINQYEIQLGELFTQPSTLAREYQILSLQAQLSMDKESLRKSTGELLG